VGEVVTDRTFIVWADPGLMTGLAWYDLESDTFGSGQYNRIDLRDQLERFAAFSARMILGYEKFIDTPGGRKTSTPEHAHRAVQVLEDFALEHKVAVATPQPSSARKLGQVVYLRRLGWYRPAKAHANDAAQHVLADLLKRRPMPQAIREKLFPGYAPRDTLAT
jgi:hypothetical protein